MVTLVEGVVSDYDTTSLFKTRDTVLVRIEVQIIDDEVDFDSPFGCIGQLLKRDSCNHLVVHVVSCDACQMFCFVNFIPKQIPELVIVLIDSNFLLL